MRDEYEQARGRLLAELRDEGIVDEQVLEAMDRVPRERFVPASFRHLAYENHAMGIGCDQTISQPYIVALMTQALEVTGGEKTLEIGTGSGYQAAILAQLGCDVFTIERIEELAARAAETLKDLGVGSVHCRVGDGSKGWPEEAPFDRIMATASAPGVPASLWSQLKDEGILVMPVGDDQQQRLYAYRKQGDRRCRSFLCDCRFVPFIGVEAWHEAAEFNDGEDGDPPFPTSLGEE